MWSASSTGTYKHENSPRIRSKCSLFTTFGRTGRSVGMVNDRSRRFLSVPRTQNYINVPQPNPDPLVMVFFLFFFFSRTQGHVSGMRAIHAESASMALAGYRTYRTAEGCIGLTRTNTPLVYPASTPMLGADEPMERP